MSKYLILIYEAEAPYETATAEVMAEVMQEHADFTAHLATLGVEILGGEALEPTSTATSVRARTDVTDGPFVETKEALGGFYVIEAPDLDAALTAARACPARFGGVEVRPVMDVG